MKRRVTILGFGKMGRLHARAFAAHQERFTVVGAFDPEPSARTNGLFFSSEREAIDAADLVVVASPPETHAGSARLALSLGRDVLVEKPMGLTVDEAEEMIQVAASYGRDLFVGHSERFNPVIQSLAERLEGETVQSIVFRRRGSLRHLGSDRNLLLHMGVHDLDLARYLVRLPARSTVVEETQRSSHIRFLLGECSVEILIEETTGERERSVVVRTCSSTFTGDLLNKTLVWNSSVGSTPISLIEVDPLTRQALAVADALDGRPHGPIASGEDSLHALRLALHPPTPLRDSAWVAAVSKLAVAENL